MHAGTNFAAGNKKWIEDGIRYDRDRRNGLVGGKGEILRINRPVQLHLHTLASPRKYLERQGQGKLSMEDYVRFKVTRLIGGKVDLDENDNEPGLSTPREPQSKDMASPAHELVNAFSNPQSKRLAYGDAMKYIERIQRPQQEIKSRPITNFVVPRLHGVSPRMSIFTKHTDETSKLSSGRASVRTNSL
jgi:hypothetical protein